MCIDGSQKSVKLVIKYSTSRNVRILLATLIEALLWKQSKILITGSDVGFLPYRRAVQRMRWSARGSAVLACSHCSPADPRPQLSTLLTYLATSGFHSNGKHSSNVVVCGAQTRTGCSSLGWQKCTGAGCAQLVCTGDLSCVSGIGRAVTSCGGCVQKSPRNGPEDGAIGL